MRAIALFVTAVGRLNTVVGRTFAWLVPISVLICFAVVIQRYVFSTTQLWLQDLYVWLNGAMFMALAGYTLLINGHVRVDILYRPAGLRRKAIMDLVGVLIFLLPFCAVVWIPIDAATGGNVRVVVTAGGAVDPIAVAMELLNHLPIPDIAIQANPSTGLVALPSWFWADGYDGAVIGSSDALGSVSVDVEVQPLVYRWSFGDGTTSETTSLGQPYPAKSDIEHVYEQSSLTAGGAYRVAVEVTFSAKYRVNGGGWQPLDPISRSFTTDYPVQQLQSVLTGR